MSKIAYAAGFVRALQEALGLGDRAVRRCVLDVSVDGAVKVFVEEFVTDDSVSKLSRLLAEIPKLDTGVTWVDRIAVENAEGSAIVVKRLEESDSPEREAVKAFLMFLKHADPARQKLMHDLLQGGV